MVSVALLVALVAQPPESILSITSGRPVVVRPRGRWIVGRRQPWTRLESKLCTSVLAPRGWTPACRPIWGMPAYRFIPVLLVVSAALLVDPFVLHGVLVVQFLESAIVLEQVPVLALAV